MADDWNNSPQYTAPQVPAYAPQVYGYEPVQFPVYTRVMSIIDLVLCCIRGLMVPLAFVGMTQIPETDPMHQTVMFEILTGLGIALFGIPGHALILMRKPIGALLVWVAILATVASFGVAFWQVGIVVEQYPAGSPERAGGYIGAGVAILVRFGLCIMVGIALIKFTAWHQSQPDR